MRSEYYKIVAHFAYRHNDNLETILIVAQLDLHPTILFWSWR